MDLISRQAAIDAIMKKPAWHNSDGSFYHSDDIRKALSELPSVEPERPTRVQDILQYLDEYLHPIVSPEHWSVYSELYDMVSMLSPAQSERKTGQWDINYLSEIYPYRCSVCNAVHRARYDFCPSCSAKMEG